MQRLTKEVAVGVRGESYDTVHAFLLNPPADPPDDYDTDLQNWAHEEFATALDPEESHDHVGTMEYTPDGEVVEFRRR
jgi:hypothetical protein